MPKTTRVYVVGDKETGVLFITLDPLHAVIVTRAQIEAYAKHKGESFEAAFGEVAGAIQGLILETDLTDRPPQGDEIVDTFAALIERGSTITDAEFCFISEVNAKDWVDLRHGYMPIEPVISTLDAYKGGPVPEVGLKGPGDEGQPKKAKAVESKGATGSVKKTPARKSRARKDK
jgi:hypothetical protein